MIRAVIIIVFIFLASNIWADAGSLADSMDSNIQLRTFLEKDNVPLNGEVIYHFELSWVGELNRYHILKAGDPVVTNLKLRGSGSSNRFYNDESGKPRSVKRITYYFTPLAMGMAYIDGVVIQYEDKLLNQKETLSAQRIGVKIIEPLPGTDAGLNVSDMIIIVLAVLFIALVVYFTCRYFQQRKLNLAEQEIKPVTIEEKYIDILKNTINPADEPVGENLIALFKLLRDYLSEKYQLNGSLTFNTIKNKLLDEEHIEPDLINKIQSLYEKAELSKFAGEEISINEFHLFYDTVEILLNRFKNNSDVVEVE